MFQKLKNIFHLFQAVLANIIFGFPSRKLTVIGVTGTDGKTTTTHLIYHILKSAGKKVSMVSTVYAKVGGKEYDTGLHTTTPNSFLIQKLLKDAVRNADNYFVLETTSHAIDQNRVFGIKFDYAVETNITHEHLDYHKTYQQYLKTKTGLLLNARYPFINADDVSFRGISRLLEEKHKQYVSYGFSKNAMSNVDMTPYTSGFNRHNYLAAYTVVKAIGISDRLIRSSLKTFTLPPGRLEVVYQKEFTVIIDFAHTPYAFESALPEIRKQFLHKGGRLIHVFGAAGLRDSSKRTLMGEASNRYADIIILTEEDYRTEDPKKIAQALAKGITKRPYSIILDRQEAIDKAIALARKSDVIVITGKSHEKSLCRGKTEYPWNEHEAVKKALQKIS